MATVDGSARTQLGEEERDDVLVLAVHPLADVGQVTKDGLLVALLLNGRGRDVVPAAVSGKLGILVAKNTESTGEELREGDE